jgi:hypothetical protein
MVPGGGFEPPTRGFSIIKTVVKILILKDKILGFCTYHNP